MESDSAETTKSSPKWIWLAVGLLVAVVIVAVVVVVGKTQSGTSVGGAGDGCKDTSAPGRYVSVETSQGNFCLQLWDDKAPVSVGNFIEYVNSQHYDGTVFHRVIPEFMIQGGGYAEDMSEKPTSAPIKNEGSNGEKNLTGTIAMARTSDPDSATSQFFVNVKDNAFLDFDEASGNAGYAVFGKVSEGMDVVMAISRVPTQPKGFHENVPVEAVVIQKMTLVK